MSKKTKARPAKKKEPRKVTGKKAREIVDRVNESLPARIELEYTNPLELAVATILSAQCTDARVNEVTRRLFKKYRDARAYAEADPEVFQEEIRPTGFFRNKTKSIISFARALVDKYGGEVPDSMDELVKLPGVGRKTANVILGSAFGVNQGIAVDTHVKRVARRLGLTAETDPAKIEAELMKLVPREQWSAFALRMIQLGRYTCTARKPKCGECPLEALCPSAHRI